MYMHVGEDGKLVCILYVPVAKRLVGRTISHAVTGVLRNSEYRAAPQIRSLNDHEIVRDRGSRVKRLNTDVS